MPVSTADIKVDAVRGWRRSAAARRQFRRGESEGDRAFPTARNDLRRRRSIIRTVIAGQGTLAMELLQQDAHLIGSSCRSAAAARPGVAVLIQASDAADQSDWRRSGRPAPARAALDAGHPVDLRARRVVRRRRGGEAHRRRNVPPMP
ncbi:hypothetical protein M8494_31450 [Serratia ureilytica]